MPHRLAIEAVPGAGKTHALLELCREDGVPSLLLAYNNQLAAAVQSVLPDGCVCMTFHALCGRCLAPARDDTQLEDAVERCERGALVPHDVPAVGRVLLDEAQDVRLLYVRLVRALGLAAGDLVVAGDRHQLVYDFDPDHPASLDVLLQPHTAFGHAVPWERKVLTESRRLTVPMARFVNAVFFSDDASDHHHHLRSTRVGDEVDGAAVEEVQVRAPKSAFALYAALRDLFVGDVSDTLLLVDRRAGNRPLRALLNDLVRRDGVRLHVHGVDSEPPPATAGANVLRCLTYWSAKGLECDTAVVLLPQQAARNPTYVALTRARRRLVVVLDPREPHAAVARAVLREPHRYDVRGEFARTALRLGADSGDPAASLAPRTSAAYAPLPPPTRADMRTRVDVAVEREGGTQQLPDGGDAPSPGPYGRVAVATALVAAEARASAGGYVRAMENVLHPTRLDPSQRAAAAAAGFVGRSVPRFVTDDALLAGDLRAAATEAYARMATLHDAAEVALATLAWDGFDHVMRQARPVADWIGHVAPVVAFALEVLPRAGEYDTRLFRPSDLVVGEAGVRVHAATDERCYHVVWDVTGADVAAAAVRASCHPRRECALVDLASRSVRRVRVT